MKQNKPWRVDLDKLTPNQLAKYEDSLEALNLIRHGTSLKKASKIVRVSSTTIKKYVGSALQIKNHRTIARKSDSLLRKMTIYENGNKIFIQVYGKKKAAIIGKYHSAISRLPNNPNSLVTFQEITIRDNKGRIHRFETNPGQIQEILERIEEPEFFNIYRSN